MKRTELRIPAMLHEKLREESFKTNRSINEIVTELIQEKYEEKKEMTKVEMVIEELKELIGKEMTLLEMDNTAIAIVEAESDSVFDGPTEDYIQDGQYAYTMWVDEEKEDTVDINIYFRVIEENEENPLVRIIDIEEL